MRNGARNVGAYCVRPRPIRQKTRDENLVEFRRRSGEIKSNPVFRRGAYVAENTARGARVKVSAAGGKPRHKAQRNPFVKEVQGLL